MRQSVNKKKAVSISELVSQWVCESMKQVSRSWSVGQTVTLDRQSVSQLLPVKVRKSISQLGRQLGSQSIGQLVRKSARQSTTNSSQ